jgi:hypothetical protein
LEEKTGKKWFWRILDFINPLRDPSLTVAAVLTFIEEAGQHDTWYWILVIALVNWLAVRGVVWLIVNFTFASTFIGRRLWWAIQHPRLAWRCGMAISSACGMASKRYVTMTCSVSPGCCSWA